MTKPGTRPIAMALIPPLILLILITATWIRNHDYRTTLSLWYAVLKVDPGNPRAELGIGEALMSSGRTLEAEGHLKRAVELSHPARNVSRDALMNLGIVYYNYGDRQRAVDTFRAILKTAPSHPQALYNLAVVLSEMFRPGSGEWNEALMAYRTLKRLLPPNSPRLRQLDTIFQNQGS